MIVILCIWLACLAILVGAVSRAPVIEDEAATDDPAGDQTSRPECRARSVS